MSAANATTKTLGLPGRVLGTVFCAVFIGIALLVGGLLGRDISKRLNVYSWTRIDCVVLESAVQQDSRRGDAAYSVQVRFDYTWQGQTRTSRQLTAQPRHLSSYAEAQRLATKFPADTPAVCYVNPSDPTMAVLERESLWLALVFLVPVVFVAFGAGGLYLLWRKPKAAASRAVSSGKKFGDRPALAGTFFALFLLIGGVIFYFMALRPALGILAARRWVETPCTVLSSQVRSHRGNKSTTYSVDILYAYQFNGREYKSDRYHFMGGSSSGHKGKAAVVRRYPPRKKTVCYVNPDDPLDAVLERDFTADLLFGLIPLVFVLIGVFGLVGTVRQARTKGTEPATAGALRVRAAGTPPPADASPPGATNRLKPVVSRTARFFEALLILGFTVFWFSMMLRFFSDIFRRGSDGVFFGAQLAFAVVFGGAGLAALGFALYKFLSLLNPRAAITATPGVVALGGATEVEWKISGGLRSIRQLRVSLEGREETTHRSGKKRVTDKSVFSAQELGRAAGPGDIRSGQARVTVPADAMHSFQAGDSQIIWSVRVRGEVPFWPDLDEEFALPVLPASADAPPRA